MKGQVALIVRLLSTPVRLDRQGRRCNLRFRVQTWIGYARAWIAFRLGRCPRCFNRILIRHSGTANAYWECPRCDLWPDRDEYGSMN